jgi:N-acetylglucosamine-6-sulfatase
MRGMHPRLPLAAAAVALVAVALVAYLAGRSRGAPPADPSAPNIVVITTDDQTPESVNRRIMPATMRLLSDRGTTFTNNIVTTPQCCPSRASFLTGQYAHNHGVLSNGHQYQAMRDRDNVLPQWMQRAGYRTAHVGRFLKGYGKTVEDNATPPPGWDEWASQLGFGYFDYKVSYDGERTEYGDDPADYSTTVFTREAVGIVREHAGGERPLFLSVNYIAPHKAPQHRGDKCKRGVPPAPRDLGRFQDVPLPGNRSLQEQDVSDKPSFIPRSRIRAWRERKMRRAYRCGLASLREVDRGVKRIYSALKEEGEEDDTVFIFTSDNGRFNGEHRLPGGKAFPYEESIKVPLIIRLPGELGGDVTPRRESRLVANIDLPATILELAKGRSCTEDGDCRRMDGRSLLPLLDGRDSEWPRNRTLLLELRERPSSGGGRLPCSYTAVRTRRDLYVRYTELRDRETGVCTPGLELEYYDLRRDPEQLENLASRGERRTRRTELGERLDALRDCSGIAGRDPASPETVFCE